MQSLPPDLQPNAEPVLAGITCADCPGSLEVRMVGGKGFLQFRCRVGHAYAVRGLVAAKERHVEDTLWAAVTALEEIASLDEDLERLAARYGRTAAGGPYAERIAQAKAHAAVIRRVIQENVPQIMEPGALDDVGPSSA
jgi:two-component system chemotaxis response regulator CheB